MNLEEALRVIKKDKNLTQEQIAKRLGYNRAYLSDAIKRGASNKLINAIKSEFEVTVTNDQITFNDAMGVTIENQIEVNGRE